MIFCLTTPHSPMSIRIKRSCWPNVWSPESVKFSWNPISRCWPLTVLPLCCQHCHLSELNNSALTGRHNNNSSTFNKHSPQRAAVTKLVRVFPSHTRQGRSFGGGLLSFSGCCISSTRYLLCNRKYRQRFVLGQQHVHVNKLAVPHHGDRASLAFNFM